jgi:hypothetical protein
VGDDPAADKQRLFNGKELVTSTKSAYQLSWPIMVWGMLVLLLYGISYNNLSNETDTMVYIKMTQKSRIAASRVSYFALRANLEQVSKPGTPSCSMTPKFGTHDPRNSPHLMPTSGCKGACRPVLTASGALSRGRLSSVLCVHQGRVLKQNI